MDEPLKMPIRTRMVELDGDYAAYHATMRMNISIKQAEALSSDLTDICAALADIIQDWNFTDDKGNPLPLGDEETPRKPAVIIEGLRSLPMEMFRLLQAKYGEVLRSPLAEATSPASSRPPQPAVSRHHRSGRR